MRKISLVILATLASACAAPNASGPAAPSSPASAKPAVAAAPAAPASAPRATRVGTTEGITEYTLPNGLRILMFPDPTQSTVTVNMTYLVGSRHEGYGETGMAHLLEHMTFKGSEANHNILKLVKDRGGHANGTTDYDRTNYFETLSAEDDNLEWALALEADRMLHCTIAQSELSTEFSVVRNEFEMGENDARSILQERILSTAYLWHNYGKSVIGSRADIERVPADVLRAFYTKYYQPDNAVLVVSGKFDEPSALASVERIYGALPKPTRELPQTYTVEPAQDGERSVTLRRNGEITLLGSAYHVMGGASTDHVALDAAMGILAREPSGRLYKALVETKLASGVSYQAQSLRDPGLAMFMVEIRDPKNAAKVREILSQTVEGFSKSKITEAEVERFRSDSIRQFDMLLSNSERMAVSLSDYAALGDFRTLFAERAAIEKVTAADVNRVVETYFKRSNRTTGDFIPTKAVDRAPLTEAPDTAAFVKDVGSGKLVEAGEEFAATVANIESRTTRTKLANGLDSAFLPKKSRGAKVMMIMNLRYGNAENLAGKAAVADLAMALLSRGTTKQSYQELQDAKDKLRARIMFSGHAGAIRVYVETRRDLLAPSIDLAAEMLTSSTFTAKELELARQEALADLEEKLTDPEARAWTTMRTATSPWPASDPRYSMTIEETIAAYKKVTADEIKAFAHDYFGATHGEVAVVGDFDSAATKQKLEGAFGGFASKKPYARLPSKPFTGAGAVKVVPIKDKEMAQIVLQSDIALRDDNPDYAAWLILGQILGGDPSSRIWMRVREAEGLSYGARAWTNADALDEVGRTTAYAIVAPQNAEKALASILDEYRKAATGVVTAAELGRAKESWSKTFDTSLSSDTSVAGRLLGGLETKRTLQWNEELRGKVRALTEADLVRVATKYLHPEKLVIVKAGSLPSATASKDAPK